MAAMAAHFLGPQQQLLSGHLLFFSISLAVPAAAIAVISYWRMGRALQQLPRREARLARILQAAHIGIWARELDTGNEQWSREAFRLFGMDAYGPPDIRRAIRQRVHLMDRSRVSAWLRSLETGSVQSADIWFRVVLPEGELRALHAQAFVEQESDERPVRIDGVVQDISAKVQVEQRLRRCEEEFRALGENSPDVIMRFDQGLRCVYANNAARNIVHVEPCEMVGRSIMEMSLPEAVVEQWKKSLEYVLQIRQTDIFEFSLETDNGEKHYQVRVVPEFPFRRAMARVLAVARDVSAIKKSELLLRRLSAHTERVREEERKKIAREVHDELGQTLTGLRMDVSLLQIELGETVPTALERLQSMKSSADRAIGIARNVTSALRPAALDLGLTAALEWLLHDLRSRSDVKYMLRTEPREIVLPEEQASALFRIAQESLTNVLKHANATVVNVVLELRDDEVVLEIRDNGKGFSVYDPRRAPSFGLVGIRERALMLGGQVEIRSRASVGTSVRVRLPAFDVDCETEELEP